MYLHSTTLGAESSVAAGVDEAGKNPAGSEAGARDWVLQAGDEQGTEERCELQVSFGFSQCSNKPSNSVGRGKKKKKTHVLSKVGLSALGAVEGVRLGVFGRDLGFGVGDGVHQS